MAQRDKDPLRNVSGKAQFAARAKTMPGGDVWFTVGQGWAFDENGERGYAVRLTMTPTNWDGELLLVPITERSDPD